MNPAALLYALQVLEILPGLIAAGQNVIGMVESSASAIKQMIVENRDPSDAEWQTLNEATAALRAQLHD